MAKTPRDLSDQFTREILHNLFEGPIHEKSKRLYILRCIRALYKDKWGWGVGPRLLFRALIEALGLQEHEDEIMRLAQPKRGRKKRVDLAIHILELKAAGKTAPQIKDILEAEGESLSEESVKSYLKTRWNKSGHILW